MSWEEALKKFPLESTVDSTGIFLIMRRYIFTELERRLLQSWLAGQLNGDDAYMLDNTLDRVRMYKKGLLACIKGDIKQQTVGAIVNPANSLMIVEGLREL